MTGTTVISVIITKPALLELEILGFLLLFINFALVNAIDYHIIVEAMPTASRYLLANAILP